MRSSRRYRMLTGVLLAACSGFVLGGCHAFDNLLSVDAPSRVIAADLNNPGSADLLTASARNEFRCAFANYVNVSGLVGWELRSTILGGSTQSFYDQRVWTVTGYGSSSYAGSDCGSNSAMYLPLSRARWFADEVLNRLDEWGSDVPNNTALTARAAAWAGYSYLIMGESMCEVAFDGGAKQAPSSSLQLAVERFDQAIAAAQTSGQDDYLNLARVGKGRALLDLGQPDQAAAAVASVPADFAYWFEYSGLSSATYNKVYRAMYTDESTSVGARYLNMSFDGVPDPRVQVTDQGHDVQGFGVELVTADKYGSLDDPIRVASGDEARLIMAEADVKAGNLPAAVAIINDLHAEVGLPAFSSSDPAEVMNQVIYERRAALFLEGQHLGDLNRYGMELYPAAGEPFPGGGLYGDERCFPLPDVETLNNPSISGS